MVEREKRSGKLKEREDRGAVQFLGRLLAITGKKSLNFQI